MPHRQLFLSLAAFCVFPTSISASEESSAPDPFEGFQGETIEVLDTIVVGVGETFDGGGNLYDWNGAGDCSQVEGMPPMFLLLPNSTLKNIWIKDAPDGVHIKGSDVTIDQMTNIDVCEDAISISKSKTYEVGKNIQILNSRFFDCYDKAIQLTRGEKILIKNNQFYSCAKAVRIKEEAKEIRFEYNQVYNSKSAVRVTGGWGSARGNLINGSREGFWAEENGSFIDAGDNVFIDVKEIYKETTGGKIDRPDAEQ